MSVQWHLRDTCSRKLSARKLGEPQFLGQKAQAWRCKTFSRAAKSAAEAKAPVKQIQSFLRRAMTLLIFQASSWFLALLF
jgi:hypothetical protein